MKNFLLIILLPLILSGCLLMPSYINHRITAGLDTVSRDYNGKNLQLDVSGNSFSDEFIAVSTTVGKEGVELSITNKTGHIVEVVWDKSVFINEHGDTKRVIHEGTRLIDRNSAQVNSIIAPESTIYDSITPAENIFFGSSSWLTGPLIRRPESTALSDKSFTEASKTAAVISKTKIGGILAIKSGDSIIFYKLSYRLTSKVVTGNFEVE